MIFCKFKNSYKKILLALFSLLIGFLTYKGFYLITERYFFDRLFYKKSISHGYYNFWPDSSDDWFKSSNDFISNARNDDLKHLVNVMIDDREALDYFAKEKEKDVFKIVLIGDSMFFGLGLRENQTLAAFLQKELGKEVKVYNFSYAGDGVLDNYAKYKFIKEYLNPDVFVLELLSNDLVLNDFDRYPQKSSIYEGLGLELGEEEFINQKKLADDGIDYDDYESVLAAYYAPSFYEDSNNFALLKKIGSAIDHESLILLSYGCRDDVTDCQDQDTAYCLEQFNYRQYTAVFGDETIFLDFCNVGYKGISETEGHPDAETNERLAKALSTLIEEKFLE
jgi:hypothetical protein